MFTLYPQYEIIRQKLLYPIIIISKFNFTIKTHTVQKLYSISIFEKLTLIN